MLGVKQNLRNELNSILGFLDLSRTFGPSKLVSRSDLRSLCPTGPTVSEPLVWELQVVQERWEDELLGLPGAPGFLLTVMHVALYIGFRYL